jgi:hypothetical protein
MNQTRDRTATKTDVLDSNENLDLAIFEPTRKLDEQIAALTRFIKLRKIHAASKTPQFEKWLLHLGEIARSTDGEAETRIKAVAVLSRISATVKALRATIAQTLQEALGEPLPPLGILTNPDDRTYVAEACGQVQAPWCARYLASASILEDTAEKARVECFRSLLKLLPNLRALLEYLRDPIAALEPTTESPADSVGRRVRRIFAAIRQAIGSDIVELGSEPGDILADIARLFFRKTGPPSTSEILNGLAEEAVALSHELIRMRFSLAVDAETYRILRVTRTWLDYRWKRFAQSSRSVSLLKRDLREAIAILAKQGKTDDDLADALEIASGSRDEARRIMAQIGQEGVGIDGGVRSWLMNAEQANFPRSGEDGHPTLAAESQQLAEATLIAEILLDAEELMEAVIAVRDLPQLDPQALDSARSDLLRTLIARAGAAADVAISFAKRRSLEVRGAVGDEVEYSPLEHDLIGGSSSGVRRVRIRRQAVMYGGTASAPIIVKKAIVEPAKTHNTTSE